MTTAYARRLAALKQSAPQGGDVLETLRGLFAQSLGVAPDTIEATRPFAEMGLTSLLAVRFLDRVNRHFGLSLGVETLFAHASLAALATQIRPPPIVAPVAQRAARSADIAIIGMSGRFPGAPDIVTLRERLAEGALLVGAMPADRLAHPVAAPPNAAAGFLSGIDRFDAGFFGISPREAAAMDPQQRLFLEECWLALENAGLPAESLRGRRIGVFAGAASAGHESLVAEESSHGLTGNLVSLLAARIAYALDLRGPAMVVDTACSASLVAVHLACQAIRAGEVEMALAGGVRLFLDDRSFATMGRIGMLSPGGRCRSFDATADGIAVGEAAAAVVLKPLDRALADGDRIEAVIRASGTNQDGRSNGITAPNGRAQAELIREVWDRAGIDPESIGLVEAHGTGTPLGDPIEVAALAEVLGERGTPAWLGSIKSNIGHTSEAAGIAGLIKAVLCLRDGLVLPSIGYDTPNPRAGFGSALRVAAEALPWTEPLRRAAVSAFGLSGTNAHVVLESPPAVAPRAVAGGPWLVALSAATAEGLPRLAARLAVWLRAQAAPRLDDVCRTLIDGRSAMAFRHAFVAPDLAAILAALDAVTPADAARVPRDAASRPAMGAPATQAAQWCAGARLDGAALYPNARRSLALPGYPFAPEVHWAAAPQGLPLRLAHDHPLVRDHLLGGAAVLHAGLFLEFARQEAARAGAFRGAMHDIAWLRTATVPEGGTLALNLAIEDGACTLSAADEARPFARAKLGAVARAPAPVDLAALRGAATQRIARSDLPGGDVVQLGPSYPGFETLWLLPDGALGCLPAPPDACGLPPRLSDAAIQVAVAALAARDGAAALRYPAALSALEMFGAAPAGEAWIYARPCEADRVDVLLLDSKGTVRQRWSGLELRAAAAAAPRLVPRSMVPDWVTVTTLPAEPAWPDLVLGEAPGLALPAPAIALEDAVALEAAVAALDVARPPVIWLLDTQSAETPQAAFTLHRLVRGLVRAGLETAAVQLRIVTAHAHCVTPQDAPRQPMAAVTEGLAKAIGVEFPAWRVAICDIDMAAPPAPLQIATEAGDSNGESIVLRGERRFRRVLRPATRTEGGALRQGGRYLVVGGMGRVGRVLCRILARDFGAKLVLLSRSPLDADRAAFLAKLGPEARYIAADIAAPGALEGIGPLDGVVQAVVDPVFGRCDRMSEAEFRAALHPKVHGLVALADWVAARPERPKLIVFSSIGAFAGFPGTAGQSAYCAACCFEASYALHLREALGLDSQVVHWGLWQHADLNPAMVSRLAAQGVDVQDAAASARALDGLLAAPQSVHAALSDAVWAAMGGPDAAAPAALAEAARAIVAPVAAQPNLHAAMDAHARALLAERLAEAGLLPAVGERLPRSRWSVASDQARLALALVEILARHGVLRAEGEDLLGLAVPDPQPAAAREAALLARDASPGMQAALALLRLCVAAVPDILAGRRAATEVLFPGGSTELVAPLYDGQPALVACNAMMAAASLAFARAQGAPLRIVEVGAGTGATTAPVLAALQAACVTFDYHVTDLSPALLRGAKARFGTAPGLHYTPLDISRDPAAQGFAEGTADLVLASDVLHATPDVAQSLRHVAALLRPGGVLLLNETTRAEDVATLTFGLLEGWWLAQDADRRLPHAPLLSIPCWAKALREAGFGAVEAVPAPGFGEADPPHAVLLARRGPHAAAAALARPTVARVPAAAMAPQGLQALLAECVGAALDLPAARIEADAPFGEIGVDSIVAPQIAEAVNDRLGIALRSTDLYNFGSLEALVRHIETRFPEVAGRLAAPAPIAAEPVAASDDAIAIIGISGRFPGAPDLPAFWEMLRTGRHAVREVDRFDLTPIRNRSNARWAALLEDHDRFDPLFFGISPAEAEAMEPQQRLLLEEGWRALEDAGLPPERLAGRSCGVFVGVSASNYVAAPAPAALQTLGGSVAILSARLSYLLDLQGPCFPVDTGCSSSLVALHLAAESLRRGESEVALAAGVSCNIISPHLFLYLSDSGMASPTGRCHSFDDAADGFVPGEGVGCLVLKRLSDARRDGDRIHAVLRGSGTNQDGRTSGLTAPSATSQTALELQVYRQAGIDPATIGMVEAHGTGTKLGDPIEVAALTDAFGQFTAQKQFCALGSVKTNIGHCMAAAGMAGVAKAVLALRHRAIPPSLNFGRPNRHIEFAATPFFVNTTLRDWDAPSPGVPRRAAISSFGFSGSNAHVVIEEAPAAEAATPAAPGGRVVPVSARSAAALEQLLRDLADGLEAAPQPLADVAAMLALRRGHFRHRRAVVAQHESELPTLLREAAARAAREAEPGVNPIPAIAAAWDAGSAATAEDLAALAALHEAGARIDWAPLADGRRPVLDLPGHPFFRQRYWAFDAMAGFAVPAAGDLVLDDSLPLLRDHVVQGRRLLPGTATLDMLRQVALGASTGTLREIAWLAPALPGMTLRAAAEGEGCSVSSAGRVLARAAVDRAPPAASPPLDLAALAARCGQAMTGEDCYAAFTRLGFAYGPALQVLAELRLGEGETLAHLRPGAGLDAATLDGALQAAALIGLEAAGAAQGDRFVPAGLEALEIHAIPAAGTPLRAHAILRADATAAAPGFDITLAEETGRLLAVLRGLRARRLPAEVSSSIGTLAFVPDWQESPLSAGTLPDGALLLLARDAALADALRAALPAGRRLTLARPEHDFDPSDAESCAALLDRVAPAMVVNALRLGASPAEGLGQALATMGVEEGARLLFLLARTVRPMALLHLEPAADGAAGSAAVALLRSAVAENGGLRARVLRMAQPTAAALLEELAEPWPEVAEIRRDGAGRTVLGRVPATLAESPPGWVRAGSTWLVTGGQGGLGLALARHLAAQGAARIALLSRGAPDAAALALVEQAGAVALHLQADVADPVALRAALARLRRQFGPLHGVAHVAGVLHDDLLARQAPQDFDAVLAPKAAGVVALDQLTANEPLDAFLLFSSTAAALGVPGQGAYAAANGFLGGFAAQRQARVAAGLRQGATLAVDWPLWQGGGMAPPAEVAAELDRQLGLLPMPQAEGFRVLGAALALGVPHLLVLHGRTDRLGAALRPVQRPPAAAAGPVEASEVIAYLARLLEEVIHLPPDRLDADERLEEYGLDSIGIMRLNARLEVDLGDVSKTLFFEHRTVRDLAARLLRDHGAALGALLAPGVAAAPPPVAEALPAPRAVAARGSGDIAIIGIAGSYPMAPDLDIFWENLREGRDAITEIPPERWPIEGFWDADRARPETSYTKWGGFLADADCFDARFFGISPVEADSLDPQARKFLETCWAALEDAGRTRATLFDGDPAPERRRGGVFVGVMNGDYALLGPEEAARGNLIGPNASYWNIANRVSWILDLHGPSLALDTACSASLSAIHAACQALRAGECSVALAGGVNLILHPSRHWILSKSGFAASDGRCRSFGVGGDGYVPGEGVGAVLLKPLERALADGDRIHAVIKGSALNHGGRSGGFTVPDPAAQGALVAEALERAGTPPASISYIEAHGTGTALGDPVEVAGLGRAFAGLPEGSLPIGSVKSNIGHLEAAAGIAGLTKVVLQLRHGMLAPSLHAEVLNPDLGLSRTPLHVQHQAAPWLATNGPRRAGISSFGAGGANAHLVVEEAPPVVPAPMVAGPFLVPLSAATEPALRRVAASLAAWLQAHPDAGPADVARTLQTGREAMRFRAAFLAGTVAELRSGFEAIAAGQGFAEGEVKRDAGGPAPDGDLAALARAWAKGSAKPDWDALAPGRRPPISLPGISFEKRRCWVKVTPRGAPAKPALALPPGIELGVADAQRKHVIGIAADAPVLAEHRVGGASILPGALLLALGLRAGGARALAEWRFLRPADAAAMAAGLSLQLEEGRIAIEAGARLAEGRVATGAPAATVLVAAEDCPQRIDGAAAYALLAGAGADYAGGFRRLLSIQRGAEAAIATLAPGAADWAEALDAAFQITFALLPEEAQAGGYLPAALGRLDILGEPQAVTRILGRRRSAEAGEIVLDLVLEDAAGAPQAILHGFVARRAAALPALEAWHAVWDPVPMPEATAPLRAPVLLAPFANAALAARLGAVLGVAPDTALPDLGTDAVWLLVGGVEDSAAQLEAAVLHLAALVRDLAARPAPPRLVVVTSGAQRARPGEKPCPLAAALAAFSRAAAREQPELRLALLDVDPADVEAPALLPALAAPGADLALRDGVALRRGFGALDLPASPAPAEGVVLIAGGAGGLGRALAEHLAERGARVVLLGRRVPSAAVAETLARGAGRILHLRADLAQPAALEAALAEAVARCGPITTVVHAAMDLREGRVLAQADADIAAVLAPKTTGLANLLAALARQEAGGAPARLVVFSSANAETANPGQAAYAAASAFADAFALRQDRPVLVLDWGFWGEVGAVATAAHRTSLARIGVHPIGTAEGLSLLFRALAAPGLDRVMPLRISDRVAAELRADATRRLAVPAEPPLRLLPAARAAAEAVQAEGGAVLRGAAEGFGAINRHATALARATLSAAGFPKAIAPQKRLEAAVQAMLAKAEPLDAVALAAQAEDLLARDPAAAPYLRLLQACTKSLPAVLTGEVDANAVLFPGGSFDLVAPIYAGNPVVDHLQHMLAQAVAAAVAARPGPVRILEVGAGTGGTTRFVLRALAPFADHVDYLFTDIGPAFLEQAEREWRAEAPFLRTARLDISAAPAAQGMVPRSFDIVIAANVLHATPRIAVTLANLHALLRPGGLVAINEATAAQDFNTLTFGLTRGWWLFGDPEARLPHAPLLDLPRWRNSLAAAGFCGVTALGDPALQCILLAEADGFGRTAPAVETPRVVTQPQRMDDGIEERLRITVAEALRLALEEVEPEASFSEYGADSIISVELVRRVNEVFGIDLKTTALFTYATVRELAAYIRLEHGAAGPAEAEQSDVADRIAGSRERTDRLRSLIRRRMEASAEPPPPDPGASDLASLLRRLEAGEIGYEDAMEMRVTDA
ncbi:SDR family NAD(P)-dependent oxidoreductase [Falsiroseomonas tokyonensis]|uniref:SDR family NAD(P)-dependent oxidoreductase n=1 Tax=Falsiroseomonas tokyonensis TaxID=430521 RepID=A0ABV7BQL1_9PROT|nr:SDR family NAD(P)-dependent oxidoreductase [Falsiroseomonas tokyonensis]MBU8536761.1 SDR family NAD(P)-dependent oxidoreductase [Falsiroseomonas tokyonensis]